MEGKHMKLYPFQKRVFEHVMNGRSVILQAPTGSGKTRAALMPFQQNLARQDNRLPLTCRYAVPMRVLANQFYREHEFLAREIDQAALTRLEDQYRHLKRNAVSVQTGEQPEDPQMEAALTFCTMFQ
jgi:CRISPR-associated endonuclease/helicase Cas3